MDKGGEFPRRPDIQRSKQAINRAAGRIPTEGVRAMNINSYIATLTDLANTPITPGEVKKSTERGIGLYTYLRDTQHAQTVGEAMDSLKDRKVDPKVVKVWVEEEMAINPNEFDAISKGYPEYAEDLKRVRKEWFDRITKK